MIIVLSMSGIALGSVNRRRLATHFRALLLQNRFPREPDAIAFHG